MDETIIPRRGAEGEEPEKKGRAPYRLAEEILARSAADTWPEAKREWELETVWLRKPDEPGTCLCGHYPIREHCLLRNRENGKPAVVGNCCVKRFVDLPSGPLFAALRRVRAGPTTTAHS